MARKKSQKVAYVVFRGHAPGVYDSWEDTRRQIHGFPGNSFLGYTAAEGGRKRAEDEFQRSLGGFRQLDDLSARNNSKPEEAGDGRLPEIAENPASKRDPTHETQHLSKRKRESTDGEKILLQTVATSDQVKAHGSNGGQDLPESLVEESTSNGVNFTAAPGKASSAISNPGNRENSSLSNVISLLSSDDDKDTAIDNTTAQRNSRKRDVVAMDTPEADEAEAEFDDASLDEYMTNNYSTFGSVEPPLCKEQADLVSLILSGRNTFYTGSAGCGKSTVLRAFVKELQNAGKIVQIVAPTGRAALDVNGTTTWTFAGWTPDHMKRPLSTLLHNARGKIVRRRLQSTDVLVIDEISMVENHFFERLNQIMKEARESPNPFGGVQIIVTGDFCQLPPVKPFLYCYQCGATMHDDNEESYTCAKHGKYLDTDKWAFKSNAWAECDFVHVNLTEIHRQSDLEFIRILDRCRLGKPLSSADQDLLLHHKCNTQNAVRLFPLREKVRELNDREFRLLSTPISIFDSHDDFDWNEQHRHLSSKQERKADGHLYALEEHRFEPTIQLRKGMQVVLLVNLDLKSGLVNGSQGIITDFEAHAEIDHGFLQQTGDHKEYKDSQITCFISHNEQHKVWPIVRFTNGLERKIFAHCIVNELGDTEPYSLLSRTQIPLMAAWAMTVHKSQGMTLSRVIVDLARSFETGQEYVALSRAKSLDGLKVLRLGNFERGADEQVREFLREKFGIS